MKRFLLLLSALLLLLTSCHKAIWDKLNDHEARIARLETFCNQLNTSIVSLQSLVNVINARDYVKDVGFLYLVLADGEEIKIAKGGLHWVYVD